MIKLLLVSILACYVNAKFKYDNYTLYKVFPESEDQVKLLQNVYGDTRFDFWSDPVSKSKSVSILASPEYKRDLETLLGGNGMNFEITMSNIQEAIDKQSVRSYERGNVRSMQWNAYYSNEEINSWLDDIRAAYPSIITPVEGGVSYENRTIRGVRLSHGPGRRSIVIEGGIHAREWISPAVVCYILNALLTSDDPMVREAASNYDWYVFPVTNPDGYIWSHVEERMWRKNRRPIGQQFGVDLNRNWNNNWLAFGASTNPATITYAGHGPFSEVETRTYSAFLRSIRDTMDIYLSFHSFGNMLLLPFGNSTAPLANYDEAMNVGRRAMGALSVRHGTRYVTGNIAETIYLATGGSIDWVKDQLQVPLVYCYELRDTGTHGFLLPADQIEPSGEETLDSVIELIHQARRFGVIPTSGANNVMTSLFMIVAAVLALF